MNFGLQLKPTEIAKNMLLNKTCENCKWVSEAMNEDEKCWSSFCDNIYNLSKKTFNLNKKMPPNEKYVIILPKEKTCQKWEPK